MEVFRRLLQRSQHGRPDVRALKEAEADFVVKVKTVCECVHVTRVMHKKRESCGDAS